MILQVKTSRNFIKVDEHINNFDSIQKKTSTWRRRGGGGEE